MPRTRSCRGKTRYRDELEAKRALTSLRRNSTRDVIPVRWYRCPRCSGVHLSKR